MSTKEHLRTAGSAGSTASEQPGSASLPPGVRLGSGTAWSLAAQIVAATASVVVGVLVARALGPEGKGTLTIVQQTVAILMVVFDLGIGLGAVYYISKGEVGPGTVLGNTLVALAAIGGVAFVAMIVLFRSPLAVIHLDWGFTLAAFGLFMANLAILWIGSIAVGILGVKGGARPSMIASLVTLAVVAGAWYAGSRSAITVVLASTVGLVLGTVFAVLSVAPRLRPIQVSAKALRLMRRYSTKLYVAGVADFLHFRQDVLMLGWLAGVGTAGVYSVGVSIAEIATRLPSAMGNAIQAQASRMSHESALDMAARAIRLTALFAVLVVGGLALVVHWLIPQLFGESFRGAVLVFYVLAPGALANALIWPISSYQNARGQVFWGVSTAGQVLNVALNLALIPQFGAVGAAAASSVSYALMVGALVFRLRRHTGMGTAFFLVPTREDLAIVVSSARSYLGRR